MNRGWLAQNLPDEVTRTDEKLTQFVDTLEPTLTEIRARIEMIPYYMDITTAPTEFVEWLGSWLDIVVPLPMADPDELDRRVRNIVHVAGTQYSTRGTKNSLEALLRAATGSNVTVQDNGGVYAGDADPDLPVMVLIDINSTGGVTAKKLFELVKRDMPVHVPFELYIGGRMVTNDNVDDHDTLVVDTDTDELEPGLEAEAARDSTPGADVVPDDEVIEGDDGNSSEDSGAGVEDSDPNEMPTGLDEILTDDEEDSNEDLEERE